MTDDDWEDAGALSSNPDFRRSRYLLRLILEKGFQIMLRRNGDGEGLNSASPPGGIRMSCESQSCASKEGKYPCPAPFSQFYMVPRTLLDLRFCSYHVPVMAPDQDAFLDGGLENLQAFFRTNPELQRRREAYLKRDYFEGAGCSHHCFF